MVFFKTMIATLVFFSFSVQAADYKAPRGPGGVHPDLNGIWQALNTANYDIEMHTASHSMQLREGPHGPLPAVKTLYLGAVGAVLPGLGVVVGGKIPYTPEALAKKQENKVNDHHIRLLFWFPPSAFMQGSARGFVKQSDLSLPPRFSTEYSFTWNTHKYSLLSIIWRCNEIFVFEKNT